MNVQDFRTVEDLPVVDDLLSSCRLYADPSDELAVQLVALPLSYYLRLQPVADSEMVDLLYFDEAKPSFLKSVSMPAAAMRFGCDLSNTVVVRSPEEFRATLCEGYDLLLVRTDISPLHEQLTVYYEEGLGIQLEAYDRYDFRGDRLVPDDVAAHCPVSGRLLIGVVVALIKL